VSYRRIRFRQRVDPGVSLRARVRQVENGRLRFSVELDGAAACTGECSVVPRARQGEAWSWQEIPGLPPFGRESRFCSDGWTLADVASRAAALCDLSRGGVPATVCVASEDRMEVAAAIVAALSGGIAIIFPAALTPEAVMATVETRGFSHWLGPAEWIEKLASLPAVRVADGPASSKSPVWRVAPDDMGRISLQTGGTTGQPRVWAKTARNLLQEVALHVRGLAVEPDDHIVATVPPNHIYGLLFSVLLPLLSGATVERSSPFFPQEIAERIARTGATILVSTPAHLRALSATLSAPHRLRLVLSSGAPLAAADAAAFHASTGLWPLEIYGSTETGGIAMRRQDVAACPWSPLPGVSCRIDSDALAVQSPFVSPDGDTDASPFFRTADLAQIRDDGRFELLGRSDGIVKVGGVRVSIPDIERVLTLLPSVTDAAVLALPSRSGRGQEIVALVASQRSADEIARELRERLASPSWPRRVRCVPSLPTTPSGKRDRSAILRLLEIDEGEAPSA